MKYLLSISFVFMSYFLFSQDPNISNLHTFRTYINPGYVGFTDNLNVNIGHRRQWLYVPRVLETSIMSANYHLGTGENGLGLGLIALNNREGEGYMTTNSVSGIIAKNLSGIVKKFHLQTTPNKKSRIKIEDSNIKFEMSGALQFGILQNSVDWTELTFSDQLDARYGNVKNTAATPQVESTPAIPDVGGGIMVRFKAKESGGVFYNKNSPLNGVIEGNYTTLGVSCQHLNQPEQSFLGGTAKLPTRWNLHGNINLQNESKKNQQRQSSRNYNAKSAIYATMYSLNFLYQTQGELTTLLVGPSIASFGFISISAWWRGSLGEYRNSDAIVFSTYSFINLSRERNLVIGASYDFTIGRLNYSRTFGTFEFSLKMNFRKGDKSNCIEADQEWFRSRNKKEQLKFMREHSQNML